MASDAYVDADPQGPCHPEGLRVRLSEVIGPSATEEARPICSPGPPGPPRLFRAHPRLVVPRGSPPLLTKDHSRARDLLTRQIEGLNQLTAPCWSKNVHGRPGAAPSCSHARSAPSSVRPAGCCRSESNGPGRWRTAGRGGFLTPLSSTACSCDPVLYSPKNKKKATFERPRTTHRSHRPAPCCQRASPTPPPRHRARL